MSLPVQNVFPPALINGEIPSGGSSTGTEVLAPVVIADNVIVRGDGGARDVQGSGITIADVSGGNVTVSSITNTSLTLATLDNNKPVIISPHGTGPLQVPAGAGIRWGASGPTLYSSGGDMFFAVGANTLVYTGAAMRPSPDNAFELGSSSSRYERLYLAPTGIKIGDGTNGPTVTTSGSSPNEKLIFTLAGTGGLNITGLPTSSVGLVAGDVWNNSGILNIV